MKTIVSILLALISISSDAGTVWSPGRADYPYISNYLATVPSPGDIVQLPAGNFTWYGYVNLAGIQLVGAGTNSTFIASEAPESGQESLVQMNVSDATHFTRLTGISFGPGVTNAYPYISYSGLVQVSGPGWNWRVDHCSFVNNTEKPIRVLDASYGLIDHNYLYMNTNAANAFEIFASGVGFGDGTWSLDPMFGSSNFVFIENNTIASSVNFATCDVAYGGRAVIRNNNFNGTWVFTHGTDSSGRYRGTRCVEVYSNNFQYGNTTFINSQYSVRIDSGTALIYNNNSTNFYNTAAYEYYRSTDAKTFSPWYGTTYTNVYDTVGATLYTNTATANSTSSPTVAATLTVSGASWTANQWAGWEVYNTRSGEIWSCNGNTSTALSFVVGPSYNNQDQTGFNTGDVVIFYKVTAGFDQPGRGKGYNYGDTGTPGLVNPAQASEPIHAWGNNVVWNGTSAQGANAYSGNYPMITAGLDYTNTPPTNYSSFPYPHFLQSVTNGPAPASATAISVKFTFIH